MKHLLHLAWFVLLATVSFGQLANTVPTLPTGITDDGSGLCQKTGGSHCAGTVMGTTYSLPVGGTTWAAHTAANLTSALAGAVPGDVIVLDAGTIYSGNFTYPSNANPLNKWVYIISSAMASLPTPGNRVHPTDAANMPKIVTPNSSAPLTVASGANYLRVAGVEVYSASNVGCNLSNLPWPVNCFAYIAIDVQDADHTVFDRMYIHGDDASQDIRQGIQFRGTSLSGGCTYAAVIDSDIEQIHQAQADSQAILASGSDGPFKANNNYLSATTEDVMFGGASCGLPGCTHHPADIEMRGNHLYKPESSWFARTTGSGIQWVNKDNFECKDCRRLLFTGNITENTWSDGQNLGSSMRLTVRTSQSGDTAVVDDLTIMSNIFLNANQMATQLGTDDNCPSTSYPLCTNPGELNRVLYANNLALMRDSSTEGADGRFPGIGWSAGGLNVNLDHNTTWSMGSTPIVKGWYKSRLTPDGCPPTPDTTAKTNVWARNNVFQAEPSGDCSPKGNTMLANSFYLPGSPTDYTVRYYGNAQLCYGSCGTYPAHNQATTNTSLMVPVNTAVLNYELQTPYTDTSDGLAAGVNNTALQAAVATTISGSNASGYFPWH